MPQREAHLVRRIAEQVVRDHDDRSLTGAVARVPDADAVVGELVARVTGFGPLQPFLDDPSVEKSCTLWRSPHAFADAAVGASGGNSAGIGLGRLARVRGIPRGQFHEFVGTDAESVVHCSARRRRSCPAL